MKNEKSLNSTNFLWSRKVKFKYIDPHSCCTIERVLHNKDCSRRLPLQARLRMKNSPKVLYYGEMGKSSCNNSFVLFCFFADAEKEMITFCAECSARIRLNIFFATSLMLPYLQWIMTFIFCPKICIMKKHYNLFWHRLKFAFLFV